MLAARRLRRAVLVELSARDARRHEAPDVDGRIVVERDAQVEVARGAHPLERAGGELRLTSSLGWVAAACGEAEGGCDYGVGNTQFHMMLIRLG